MHGAAEVRTLADLAAVIQALPTEVGEAKAGRTDGRLVAQRMTITKRHRDVPTPLRTLSRHITGSPNEENWAGVDIRHLLRVDRDGGETDWRLCRLIRKATKEAYKAKQRAKRKPITSGVTKRANRLAADAVAHIRAILNCAATHGYIGDADNRGDAPWSPIPTEWEGAWAQLNAILHATGIAGMAGGFRLLLELLAEQGATDPKGTPDQWQAVLNALPSATETLPRHRFASAIRAYTYLYENNHISGVEPPRLEQTRGLPGRDTSKRLWSEGECLALATHALKGGEDLLLALAPLNKTVPAMAEDLLAYCAWRMKFKTQPFGPATFYDGVVSRTIGAIAYKQVTEITIRNAFYNLGAIITKLGAEGLNLKKATLADLVIFAGTAVGRGVDRKARVADLVPRSELYDLLILATPFLGNYVFLRANAKITTSVEALKVPTENILRAAHQGSLDEQDERGTHREVNAGADKPIKAAETISFLTPHGSRPVYWAEDKALDRFVFYETLLAGHTAVACQLSEAVGVVDPADPNAGIAYLRAHPGWHADDRLDRERISEWLRRLGLNQYMLVTAARSESIRRFEVKEFVDSLGGKKFLYPYWKFKTRNNHMVQVDVLNTTNRWIPGVYDMRVHDLYVRDARPILLNGEQSTALFVPNVRDASEVADAEVRLGSRVVEGLQWSLTGFNADAAHLVRALERISGNKEAFGRREYIWRHGVASWLYYYNSPEAAQVLLGHKSGKTTHDAYNGIGIENQPVERGKEAYLARYLQDTDPFAVRR